jgi:putative SOS response-associated peptidase YedK
MCGRLVVTSNFKERIKAIFAEIEAEEWLPPRYNITPAQRVPVLRDADPGRLQWVQWGFSATTPKRPMLINARGETVHQLPTFREAFAARRCVVLADGFYEWRRDQSLPRPQPYFFQRADGFPFALAGLWREGEPVSCLVITTEANSLMHPIHDRMPVIFSPDSARMWLNRETHPETLRALLQPCPPDILNCHPVSDRVNKAGREGEHLIAPITILEQASLF